MRERGIERERGIDSEGKKVRERERIILNRFRFESQPTFFK